MKSHSIRFACLALCSFPIFPSFLNAAELKGLWLFDDSTAIGKATVGTDLVIVGTAPSWASEMSHDDTELSGVITTIVGQPNHLLANHGIGANGGNATRTAEYTLVYDVSRPAGDLWRSFYQTDLTNSSDAEYFIRGAGGTVNSIGRSSIGYSSFAMPADQWRRLVISVKLGTTFTSHIIDTNGTVTSHSHSPLTEANNEYSLDPAALLFFADNSAGENHPLNIGMVAIYDGALDITEVTELGPPGTMLDYTPPIPSGIPDGLVGLWEFDDDSNITAATHGTDLTIVGTAPSFSSSFSDGHPSVRTLQGAITTTAGTANHLRAVHGIGSNGGGTKSNQYSMVYDVLIPEGNAWRSFYQTSNTNNNDGEYFVRNTNNTLGISSLGYSTNPLTANRWHRLVISADLTASGHFRAYLDGTLFHSHNKPALDGNHALDLSQVLLFADENNENQPLVIGMAAMFSKALTAEEIAVFGSPGISLIPAAENQAPTLVSQTAGPTIANTGETVAFDFVATDINSDPVQVQADWGDGTFSEWSGFQDSGTSQELSYIWSFPASYAIKARARDINGALSPWIDIQTIDLTGTPQVTFSTPPYLQNMSTTTMVVMAEVVENFSYQVQYGTDGNYGSAVTMESVASGGGTFFIRGVITGLQPGTAYQYRIATPQEEPLTDGATFRTAPADWEDFSFGALGDIQTTNGGTWTADPWEPAKIMLQDMVDRGVSFGLGIGDHAQDGNTYTPTKNSFLNRMCAVLGAKVPFYIAWGNHDGSSASHPLRLAADMPSRWRNDTSSAHASGFGSFSYVHSGVFFVCIEHFNAFSGTHSFNTNTSTNDITNGWLDAQLSSAEAQNARFRVVSIHVPPFSERWIDGNAGLRTHLVPRLEQYGVDLCFSGHMHAYQRGQLNGVNYVISGTGSYLDFNEPLTTDWPHMTVGGYHNVPGLYARQSSAGVLGTPQPIVGGLFHGYSHITVRDRYLRLDQHGYNADGSYIGILDTLEIGGEDPGPDSDGDGMRDLWETAHGLDPENPDDAHGDADGDGQSNLMEYLAGTDPTDASSMFFASPPAMSDDQMEISWSSIPGKRYRLWVSENLGTWSLIETAPGQPLVIEATAGETTSQSITNPFSERGFIRVEVIR